MRFQITGVKLPGHRPVTITINAEDEAEARELAACNDIDVRSVGPAPDAARAAAVADRPALPRNARTHRSRVAEFLPPAGSKKQHRAQRGWLVLIAGATAAVVAGVVAAVVAWLA